MFIESYRQAHGQAKQGNNRTIPKVFVTKEGNFYYILGGAALIVSFFLPALQNESLTIAPYQALVANQLTLKLLPLLYLLGLSTFLMVGAGRFRKEGIPNHLIILHLLLSVGLIIGIGVFLHGALLGTGDRFGLTMMSLALLCWWPLFIRFMGTWFWRKRPFLAKLLSTTWISAACSGLIFLAGMLDIYYHKKYQISHGMIVSAVGMLSIMLGGIKNERSSSRLQ